MQKLLQKESDDSNYDPFLEKASDLFDKACLDAIHWWVTKEYRYHLSFSQSSKSLGSDFIQFTKDYSLFRLIKTEQRQEVLGELLSADFIEEVLIAGKYANIDSYLKLTGTTYHRKKDEMLVHSYHLSMLTKFATLIDPETFTMLDRNAVDSISKVLDSYDYDYVKQFLKKDYSYFKKGFDIFTELVTLQDYFSNIDKHYAYLGDNFSQYPISRLAFQNRVLDKFLWHSYNQGK